MSAAYRLLSAASSLVRAANAADEESRQALSSRRALLKGLSAQIRGVAGVSGSLEETISSLLSAAEDKMVASSSVEDKAEGEGEDVDSEDTSAQIQDKPQQAWADDIDNDRFTPFKPKLETKPNSIAPLMMKMSRFEEDNDEVLGESLGPNNFYCHPYEHELQLLKYEKWQIEDASSISVAAYQKRLHDVTRPFTHVLTEDDFDQFVVELEARTKYEVKEIAIDLEHHSYRSFQGFTCLMQVSTRDRDWVIDTLSCRPYMHRLNKIFTNPKVVKVLHGCRNDVLWLQKDFSLYLVNVFDTYFAAQILGFPHLSLKYLLKKYVRFEADKAQQSSDWRTRPLSDKQLKYARDDTRYLLYVYDSLRRDLWKFQHKGVGIEEEEEDDKYRGLDLVVKVLERSKTLCLQRYEKERFAPRGYLRVLLQKEKRGEGVYSKAEGDGPTKGKERMQQIKACLTQSQTQCFDALYDWRDRTARKEDESTAYLLSNDELVAIGLAAPTSLRALLDVYDKAVGDPKGGLRPLRKNEAVVSRQSTLIDVITGSGWVELRRSSTSSSKQNDRGHKAERKARSELLAKNSGGKHGTRSSLFSSRLLEELHPSSLVPRAASAAASASIPHSFFTDAHRWFPPCTAGSSGGSKGGKSIPHKGEKHEHEHDHEHDHEHKRGTLLKVDSRAEHRSFSGVAEARKVFQEILRPVMDAALALSQREEEADGNEGEGTTTEDRHRSLVTEREDQKDHHRAEKVGEDMIFNMDEEEVKRRKKKRKIDNVQAVSSDDHITTFDYSELAAASSIAATAGSGTRDASKVKKTVDKGVDKAGKGVKKANPYLSKKEKVERRRVSSHISK